MELIRTIPGMDAKLDGMLSLLMRDVDEKYAEDSRRLYDTCSDLFGEELPVLQEILCDDGFVRCFVGPQGLAMEITREGMLFMSGGGYSHEIREEIVCHRQEVRSMVNAKFWNTVVIAVAFMAISICFLLSRHG